MRLKLLLTKVFVFTAILFSVSFSGDLKDYEKVDISIFKNSKESVVFISTKKKIVDYNTLTRYNVPRGSGSGFVWNKNGYIVTNFHVIDGASSATVKLFNGKSYNAFLVGAYPRRDIAVLKINASVDNLKPIKIGSSSTLKVGQSVYAIGNPYGLDWTMTKGIISALNRKVPSNDGILMSEAIQTDAAINPGNSGGVMLNSSGEVIGVNSAIFSPSGGSVGIGFAIPIDLVKQVVDKIIVYGKYIKPSIGIESDDRVNNYLKRNLNIKGVAILGVIKGSDAYKKSLKPAIVYLDGTIEFKDIITAVNGKSVENSYDLNDILEKLKIGSSVELTLLRDNKKVKVKVDLVGIDE
jgi:S1-C subfamily serine protease